MGVKDAMDSPAIVVSVDGQDEVVNTTRAWVKFKANKDLKGIESHEVYGIGIIQIYKIDSKTYNSITRYQINVWRSTPILIPNYQPKRSQLSLCP